MDLPYGIGWSHRTTCLISAHGIMRVPERYRGGVPPRVTPLASTRNATRRVQMTPRKNSAPPPKSTMSMIASTGGSAIPATANTSPTMTIRAVRPLQPYRAS